MNQEKIGKLIKDIRKKNNLNLNLFSQLIKGYEYEKKYDMIGTGGALSDLLYSNVSNDKNGKSDT